MAAKTLAESGENRVVNHNPTPTPFYLKRLIDSIAGYVNLVIEYKCSPQSSRPPKALKTLKAGETARGLAGKI